MIIKVRCKPNSKQQKIETVSENNLLVRIKSPPVDGKANKELIEILAKHFAVTKSQVNIKHGHNSPDKLVEIDFN